MAITLTIEKSPPGGAPVGASRPFDKARVTLGRGQCDWVLPGDSTLSRIHCQIVCENGIFEVIDTSQAGVFMNGAPEPLGPDNRAPLSDGDLLTFGSEYNLRVDLPAQSRNPFLPDMGADTNTEALSPFARIPEFQPFPPPEAKPDYLNDPALPMRDDAPPETLDIGRMGRRIIPDDWDGAGMAPTPLLPERLVFIPSILFFGVGLSRNDSIESVVLAASSSSGRASRFARYVP